MICEFCGAALEPKTVDVNGREFVIGHSECECAEAIKQAEYASWVENSRKRYNESKRRMAKIEESRIPERYRSATLENEKLYKTACETGLYIHGGVGTGKTYIASAIGIRAIQSGRKVRFVKAYELSKQFFESYDMESVTRPDLLIIDDLGADNVSEWANTRMRAVIDDRYGSMKPTVVTSNYSLGALAKKLHTNDDYTAQAIVDRLKEMTFTVELSGKSKR